MSGNKQHGAVFTPPHIAALAAAIDKGGKVMDPFCGNGNLLVAVVERRLNAGLDPGTIAAQVFGIEIQEQYALECRERLVELLGEEHRATITRNIVNADFLAPIPKNTVDNGTLPGL